MISARDLMHPDVLTARDDMDLAELAAFLTENEITGAPVKNDNGEVVGVVSVVDLARADSEKNNGAGWSEVVTSSYAYDWDQPLSDDKLRLFKLAADRRSVRDIMNPSIHAVAADASLPEVVREMRRYHLHRVLVVDEGSLVGIISTSDLLDLLEETQ